MQFYRPGPPPRVTGRAFAAFLSALRDTGVFEVTAGVNTVAFKFGHAVDHDAEDTLNEVPIPGVWGKYSFKEIGWDIDRRLTLADTIGMLSDDDRPLCRAFTFIGHLDPRIGTRLQTPRPGGGGQCNLNLETASVSLGPATVCSIAAGRTYKVGWMSVEFDGEGHLHPLTPRDLTDRAGILPELRPLTSACRRAFPVDPTYAGPLFGRSRFTDLFRAKMYALKSMGDLWPFDRYDVPSDWYWGVSETG